MERTLSRSPVHSKHGPSPPPHLDAKRAPARNKAQAWLLILRDNEPSDEADPHITTSDRLERHAHDPRGVASPKNSVRPDGAVYQWRKVPPSELSVALVPDER